ncbi:MAG: hypothetical protein ACLPNY_02235 [Roseiarcus sp.]
MSDRVASYVFRDKHFTLAGNTVVSAAPRDLVVSIFGGGGLKGEGGLSAVFGGAVVFRDEDTGLLYLGVWGSRNASRFRKALRDAAYALSEIPSCPTSGFSIGQPAFLTPQRGGSLAAITTTISWLSEGPIIWCRALTLEPLAEFTNRVIFPPASGLQ